MYIYHKNIIDSFPQIEIKYNPSLIDTMRRGRVVAWTYFPSLSFLYRGSLSGFVICTTLTRKNTVNYDRACINYQNTRRDTLYGTADVNCMHDVLYDTPDATGTLLYCDGRVM